jgi:hypothetical protein
VLDQLMVEEGWRGGREGKESWVSPDRPLDPGSRRLGNLLEKHSLFWRLIAVPEVLAAVHYVIKDEIKVGAVDMREPIVGEGCQELHIDWTARLRATDPFDCVFVGFVVDDMSASNGAMRIVPGSHATVNWPDAHIDIHRPHPSEMQLEVAAGSFIVMNAHTWHAGATNVSGARRRVVYIDYRNRRLPQLLNQHKYLTVATKARLTDLERYLAGVSSDDPVQQADSVGPGATYREWLKAISATRDG